ncbi:MULTISPECIES: MoaD/ThiS family protein [Streptomyces]|uniref:MoaD/ThiS family protein n=1 Tax=Streptomyces lycii TaxID=2654337 RepID=A0ABQ7FLI0_9ACTN|nr:MULTISPECIES: MoaD/ThiS family protein [Streptomyces]KAF4409540.1 MoaD/ThiS family protein [Streptomyces lycii]PGH48053.1 molybdopterin synthase sulfur carrier subunit [Streptomyces sp. Ru87]
MTTTVRIPTILRQYTGGSAEVQVDPAGPTVAETLRALEAGHPGILARVCDEQGALRRFVNLYVDDEDVRMAEGLDTKLSDGALVSIIPAVAGG